MRHSPLDDTDKLRLLFPIEPFSEAPRHSRRESSFRRADDADSFSKPSANSRYADESLNHLERQTPGAN